MRASAKTVRNVSLVGKVGLEDVCRVGLDAVEEVIVVVVHCKFGCQC